MIFNSALLRKSCHILAMMVVEVLHWVALTSHACSYACCLIREHYCAGRGPERGTQTARPCRHPQATHDPVWLAEVGLRPDPSGADLPGLSPSSGGPKGRSVATDWEKSLQLFTHSRKALALRRRACARRAASPPLSRARPSSTAMP